MSDKPVLYYTPRSPPCRAVLLTAAALGLELDLRAVNVKAGEHLTAEFLKLNPQHTIPVLDDNGTVVSDSHIICSYLADKFGGASDSLYPRDPAQRRTVDARLYYDCGHIFPRIRFIVEPVIYFGVSDVPADRVVYLQKAYDGLEHCLASGPYLAGDKLTIADLCCIASVSTAEAFAPLEAAKYPLLAEWVKRLQALPYYQKSNQEGLDLLVNLVKGLLAERQQKHT
ncbi:GL17783 [Drosophila persimilis]|uniref:GL17783 n=1 Tax=Drosophila persimilis TaxID=7234 RepID=B4GIZ3_DROPE|nr:glutathione S-transferase 1 [Drosophila persimilis]XP_026840866.1 glutathione S-transferase 1 [Drosophila persimilis]EDW36411.1 GL17783 [Drosophila persimilis]